VFEKGYPSSHLGIPMRNTGTLWTFNNSLEENIYSGNRIISNEFDRKKAEIKEYINSADGKADLYEGKTKFVMWTNEGVNKYNRKLRKVLFGEELATARKYLPTDKIILIKPLTAISGLERYNDLSLKRLAGNKKKEVTSFYANAKAEVKDCKEVIVKLNTSLSILCYKIYVECEGIDTVFYEPLNPMDLNVVEAFYKHIAWSQKSAESKKKAFREMWFILSLFAHVKHFYATTTYRMQGSTIPNVIVVNKDIAKCQNMVEQSKHRYVACSRVKDNLWFYRG
jgi:hypothetical protein